MIERPSQKRNGRRVPELGVDLRQRVHRSPAIVPTRERAELLGQLCGLGSRGATMVLGVAHSTDCATFTTFYRVDTPQARTFLGLYVDLRANGSQ